MLLQNLPCNVMSWQSLLCMCVSVKPIFLNSSHTCGGVSNADRRLGQSTSLPRDVSRQTSGVMAAPTVAIIREGPRGVCMEPREYWPRASWVCFSMYNWHVECIPGVFMSIKTFHILLRILKTFHILLKIVFFFLCNWIWPSWHWSRLVGWHVLHLPAPPSTRVITRPMQVLYWLSITLSWNGAIEAHKEVWLLTPIGSCHLGCN